MTDEEDEKLEEVQAGKVADADTGANGNVSIFRSIRPATAGISFALSHTGSAPFSITIAVSVGQYSKVELGETGGNDGAIQGEQPQEHSTTDASVQDTSKTSKKRKWHWIRDHKVCSRTVALEQGIQEIDLGTTDDAGSRTVPGLALFIKTVRIDGKIAVTVQAINQNRHDASSTRDEVEQQAFFQFEMNISPVAPTELVPRPVLNVPNDEDAKTSALIYRDAVEYATGHTCSADWIISDDRVVSTVSTAWMPEKIVKSVDPSGDPIFKTTYDKRGLGMPTAQRLSVASKSELQAIFAGLTDAYENWLQQEAANTEIHDSDALRNQAEIHLSRCGEALERMRFGASQIVADDQVRRAFQCANAAMQIQAAWGRNIPSGISESPRSQLEWRPFQLGFALMCIRSFQEPSHDDRSILDLIWFPTGGGKTEAYLLVAAFAMFYRRLINQGKDHCYGTNVLMRYTLRTLTIQQFQRAAALVCACERVRECEWNQDGSMEGQKFSIGLWVGQASTPNNSQVALDVLGDGQ